MEEFNKYIDDLLKFDKDTIGTLVGYATNLIVAGLVLWIGMKLVKKISNTVDKLMTKANVSSNIKPFLMNIVDVSLKIVLFFIVLKILGANLSGLVALLAAAGFAIGMSLQGSLGNFASGLLILTLKPYKVGDWIQLGDKFGRVEEIMIFNTKVITPGSKVLIIPNSKVTDDIITNFSERELIRLEIDIHIPYEEDWKKVKNILTESIAKVDKVLAEPKPEIGIADFDSHSLYVMVRPYVHPNDYWEVTFAAHEALKNALYENNIRVPYSEGIEYGTFGK
jgi:small conductance mechanosensitive channel